jgi:hypothetical protein
LAVFLSWPASFFFRCTENNLAPEEESELLLQHDQDQDSSPNLPAGRYEAAARFTRAQIGARVGRTLSEIQFYIADKPATCTLKIYSEQSASAPGSLLYSADVTATTQANSWNVHQLTQAITLPRNDIWISIEFSHAAWQATIGCDPGPAVQDGDWLFAASDSQWQTLRQRTTIDINWNIRGVVK